MICDAHVQEEHARRPRTLEQLRADAHTIAADYTERERHTDRTVAWQLIIDEGRRHPDDSPMQHTLRIACAVLAGRAGTGAAQPVEQAHTAAELNAHAQALHTAASTSPWRERLERAAGAVAMLATQLATN